MNKQRVIKTAFWLLTIFAVWCSLGQCGQGRVSEAFSSTDSGLQSARKTIEKDFPAHIEYLQSIVSVYPDPKQRQQMEELVQVQKALVRYNQYMDNVRTRLLTDARLPEEPQMDAAYWKANSPMAQQILLQGQPNLLQQIAEKTDQLRASMLALVDNDARVLASLPSVFKATADGNYQLRGISGSFRALPLSGALAIFSALQLDASLSMQEIIYYGYDQFGYHPLCVLEHFQPRVLTASPYIMEGERYAADIIFSHDSQAEVLKIAVNGNYLPVENGIAHYETTTGGSGLKSFTAYIMASVVRENKHGLYRDTFRLKKEFYYHVGRREVFIHHPDSLYYFYAGVENPMSVSASAYSCNDPKVTATGGRLKNVGGGHFSVLPNSLQAVSILVQDRTFRYSVRPLPDPTPTFAGFNSGSNIQTELLVDETYLATHFPQDFDFAATCTIKDFHLIRFRPREDPAEADNTGADFNQEVLELVRTARSGDRLLFEEIRVQCPGDQRARTISALSLRVR